MKQYAYDLPARIAALTPRTPGHRFVIYSDACSGVPEAPHEQTFAAVNAVVRRLDPQPEFIVFPGDEIVGLTADPDRLRAQWRHWLEKEMGWLDQTKVPLWQTTGNHTTYDAMSEGVFTEVLSLALAISGWVACGFGEAVEERAWDCCHVLGLRGR